MDISEKCGVVVVVILVILLLASFGRLAYELVNYETQKIDDEHRAMIAKNKVSLEALEEALKEAEIEMIWQREWLFERVVTHVHQRAERSKAVWK